MPNEKNYVIPSEVFHVAKKFDTVLRDYEKKSIELTEAYNAQLIRMNEACKIEAKVLWFKLAASVEIDALASWNDPSFFLDRTYIKNDFAAIRRVQPDPHPMNMMEQHQRIAGENPLDRVKKGMN